MLAARVFPGRVSDVRSVLASAAYYSLRGAARHASRLAGVWGAGAPIIVASGVFGSVALILIPQAWSGSPGWLVSDPIRLH